MTILRLASLLFGSIAMFNIGTAGAAEAKCSSSRSLVATKALSLPDTAGWQITAKESAGTVSCSARLKQDKRKFSVLYYPEQKYRGHTWYLDAFDETLALPENMQETTALLQIDGRDTTERGKFLAVGVTRGVQRVSSFIRLEYLSDDFSLLKNASEIKFKAGGKLRLNLTIPHLSPVIRALESCYQQASGDTKEEFWREAESKCG